MNTIQVSVTLVQYMSIGIFALIAGQMVLVSHYLVSGLVAVSAVTYLLAVILLCLFTSQFITHYRTNRNRMILLYAFATALLVGSVSTAGIFRILDLAGTPPERGPQMEGYIFVDFLPVRDPFYPPIPINAMLHIEAMPAYFWISGIYLDVGWHCYAFTHTLFREIRKYQISGSLQAPF